MSTPSAATLSLSDQAVLTVLCGLLPVDTPRELSIPQIAAAGGFLHSQVSASLDALERAGLIVRAHSSFGRAPTILRPATPLPARSDPAEAPRPAVPRRRSVPALLAAYLGGFAPGTVLSTSLHELGEAVGGFSPNKVGAELGKLELEGLVERLPGPRLKLRICGPIPSPEPEQDVLNQLSAHLSGRPLGKELGLTVEQLARGIGRSPMSVVRSLRVLEAEGYLRRTLSGRRTGLILLRPLDTVAAALPAPARPTSVPKLPAAKLPSPHALLWTHLRTTLPQRPQIDWLLSGLTTTVLADKTILTGVDVVRTTFARALHRTLASALHALELPHVLVIQQAPAESGPALASGALDAALAAGSVSTLLDAVQALPRLSEAEARALLALVQTGQAAQERQTIRKRCSVELTEAIARGSAAWERLLLSHVRLVAAIARRLSSERVSLEERVQAGLLGLLEAVAQSD
jgi:DNA-binding MarR family transcriptional regulator